MQEQVKSGVQHGRQPWIRIWFRSTTAQREALTITASRMRRWMQTSWMQDQPLIRHIVSLYTSSAESIAASDYLSEEVPQTYVIGGYYPYKDWGDGESYQRLQFSATYPTTVLEMASSSGSGSYLFDDTTELWYKQWGIEDRYDFYLNQEVMNSKVYDNGRYQVMFARGI